MTLTKEAAFGQRQLKGEPEEIIHHDGKQDGHGDDVSPVARAHKGDQDREKNGRTRQKAEIRHRLDVDVAEDENGADLQERPFARNHLCACFISPERSEQEHEAHQPEGDDGRGGKERRQEDGVRNFFGRNGVLNLRRNDIEKADEAIEQKNDRCADIGFSHVRPPKRLWNTPCPHSCRRRGHSLDSWMRRHS